MKFNIVTIFPDLINDFVNHGLLSKAIDKRVLEVKTWNPRYYSDDKNGRIDQFLNQIDLKDIVLETCPTSNIATKIYENYENHPVKKLHELGAKVTVNSDDPPFFNATIQGEYEAMSNIGFTDDALISMTRNAIEYSFLDEQKKREVLAKLN